MYCANEQRRSLARMVNASRLQQHFPRDLCRSRTYFCHTSHIRAYCKTFLILGRRYLVFLINYFHPMEFGRTRRSNPSTTVSLTVQSSGCYLMHTCCPPTTRSSADRDVPARRVATSDHCCNINQKHHCRTRLRRTSEQRLARHAHCTARPFIAIG